jgi:hypothetical protein
MANKSDTKLLLAAGVAGVVAYWAYQKKNAPSVSGIPGVAGIPGVGAMLPASNLLPESLRGKCSPAVADAVVWGGAGYLLAKHGRKLLKF